MWHPLAAWTFAAALVEIALGACIRDGAPRAASPPPAAQGERITLHGTAHDSKAGAVVVTDAGQVVYVSGLDSWSQAKLGGRKVSVTGVLRRTKHIPDPVNAQGELTQGAWGEQDVLEDARWQADEP